MPTFRLFRLSTYLTLGASFLALAYAEWIFVPEATVLMLLMIAVLVALYLYEDRLPLTLRGANRVGGVLGLAASGWLAWKMSQPGSGLLENLPWSVRIMPYIGPVLAVLLPAKILRPNKHVGDYWAFHASALCLVALATAMAEDAIFFALVLLYLILFVWSLVLFFMMRASGQVAPLPSHRLLPSPVAHASAVDDHPRRREVRLVLASLLVAIGLAMPFFLVTPRTGGPVWDLAGRRFEVGFAADQLLDLNRTGTLHLNTETAFEVEIRDAGTGAPVEMFPTETRWRSVNGTYTHYKNGTWPAREQINLNSSTMNFRILGLPETPGTYAPPTFGPGTVQIRYAVPTRLRALLVADPIQWNPASLSPIATIDPSGPLPWAIRSDGRLMPVPPMRLRQPTVFYMQVIQPDPTRAFSPPLVPVWKTPPPKETDERAVDRKAILEYEEQLRNNPVPAVKEYTDRLLQRLVSAGRLPASVSADIDPATGLPHERQHIIIAEALRDHLRSSGEFAYSSYLRRQDPRIDPMEDFLRNTREGHCERFATALVLMLRSQGIPAQYVLGFRGMEYVDSGKFNIRHDHAHAWAEALVPFPGDRTGRVYQWFSLDATPGFDEMNAFAGGSWWEQTLNRSRELLSSYVVGYDSNSREKVMVAISENSTWENGAIAASLILLALLAARFLRRRRRVKRRQTSLGWSRSYSGLLHALRPLGLLPEPGQTPQEFAAAAQSKLRQSPHTAAVANVPRDWAEAHYASHFGGHTIAPDRAAELDRSLEMLRRAVRQGG